MSLAAPAVMIFIIQARRAVLMGQDAFHHQLRGAGAGNALGASLILFWLRFGAGLVLIGFVVLVTILGSLPLIAFIAWAVFALVELACCARVVGHWDEWEAQVGPKMRQEVDGWRDGRIMGRVAEGVSTSSAFWYAVAAALAGSVDAVTAARLLGGRPVAKWRVIWSCAVRGAFLAVLLALIGLLVGPGGARF